MSCGRVIWTTHCSRHWTSTQQLLLFIQRPTVRLPRLTNACKTISNTCRCAPKRRPYAAPSKSRRRHALLHATHWSGQGQRVWLSRGVRHMQVVQGRACKCAASALDAGEAGKAEVVGYRAMQVSGHRCWLRQRLCKATVHFVARSSDWHLRWTASQPRTCTARVHSKLRVCFCHPMGPKVPCRAFGCTMPLINLDNDSTHRGVHLVHAAG